MDLGAGGISCSFFLSSGQERDSLWRRLILVIFDQGVQLQCRLFLLVQASIFGALVGLGRFVPCSFGANHCRLRHVGWERCSHGHTSRPRESTSAAFLNELLGVFRYLPGSGRALLAGTLPLRYCAARFNCRTPTWRLPVSGHVVDLVTASVGAVQEAIVEGDGHEVLWVSGFGPGMKRIRLNRKTQHTSRGLWFNLVHEFGRGCVMWDFPVFPFLITRGGVVIRMMGEKILLRSGQGLGNSLGFVQVSRFCTLSISS